jgi:hypothetical protein
LLDKTCIGTDQHCPSAEHREGISENRQRGDRRAGDADRSTGPEPSAPADPRHQQGGRNRRQHSSGHLQRDRQGRERLVGRQQIVDDRGSGAEDAVAGHRQGLAQREQKDYAPGGDRRGHARNAGSR